MSEEQNKQEAAIQQKLAAMFSANSDNVSIPKIYIDMTGDIEAAAVLDELMFWTLPKRATGKTSLRVFKKGALWLAVRRADWWERKRITERQADTAIAKLVKAGLVEKDVFLFDGKPTVHLRMKMSVFVKMYGDKMAELAAQEKDETLIRDISDLYEMMGLPNETVNSILQNGEMLNLQNGEIINSPVQPPNTTDGADAPGFSFPEPTPTKKLGDQLDGLLALSQSPGIKRQARIDAILSVLAERLHVRTTGKRWEEFAKLVDDRQQNFGEKLDVFLEWLVSQKGFNPQYWPPARMAEFWPQAFTAPTTKPIEYYTPPKDEGEYISKEEAKRRGLAK